MDIAIPLFEGITALDAIGPYEVLSRLPGARVPKPPGTMSTSGCGTAERGSSATRVSWRLSVR